MVSRFEFFMFLLDLILFFYSPGTMSIYVNTTTLVIELNIGEFLETKVFRLEQGLFFK